VSIAVGETPGFLYQVRGYTYSNKRIGVSGDYVNDEIHRDGCADLFLGAEPDIYYYEFTPNGNRLDVLIVNSFRDEFYYQVAVPPAVSVYRDLCLHQSNYTAIIVQGPSRSAYFSPCLNGAYKSQRIYGKISQQDVPNAEVSPVETKNFNVPRPVSR